MNHRLKLFAVWFFGYVICVCIVLACFYTKSLILDDLVPDLSSLTGIFAPYLTALVAFWFANSRGGADETNERLPYLVAMACSVFYNMLLILILTSVFFRTGEGLVDKTLKTMSGISTLMAFLVGPAIGYFFGKAKSHENPSDVIPSDGQKGKLPSTLGGSLPPSTRPPG